MEYWFYQASPYFIPLLGFCASIVFLTVVILIQVLSSVCGPRDDNQSWKEKFIEIHIKSARILLGKFVSSRKGDQGIIIHGSAFTGRLAYLYLFISEFIVVGTIFLIAVSNLIRVTVEDCNPVNKRSDCFHTDTHSPQNCTAYLEKGEASQLICHNINYDFGIALGTLGGLLTLLPLTYSYITDFIITNTTERDEMKWVIMIFQLALSFLCLVCLAGSVAAAAINDFHSTKTFVQIIIFLLFMFNIFFIPWCCMKRDSTRVYVANQEGQVTEGYEWIDDQEAAPLNFKGYRDPFRRPNPRKY